MSKLDRLEEAISFGGQNIAVKEQPHKVTKQFIKLVVGLVVDGFKKKVAEDDAVDFVELMLTEKPFKALNLFIPELTEDLFDEATNREIKHAFETAFKVNGLEFEKLIKNYLTPILSQFQMMR